MNIFKKIKSTLSNRYRLYVKRDPFLIEVARWFRNKGDETLRLDYDLSKESVVFDVGGYQGDFANKINKRFGSKVYVFEPVNSFYKVCVERFKNNPQITCLNYGLSSSNGFLQIGLSDDASSFNSPHANSTFEQVEIRSVIEVIRDLKVEKIDLFKINIEGGEFDVIPELIKSQDIKKIKHLQVQFHNFVNSAIEKRDQIRLDLNKTHNEMWNFEFVWESWKLKDVRH